MEYDPKFDRRRWSYVPKNVLLHIVKTAVKIIMSIVDWLLE
jgi:hypothetical protein